MTREQRIIVSNVLDVCSADPEYTKAEDRLDQYNTLLIQARCANNLELSELVDGLMDLHEDFLAMKREQAREDLYANSEFMSSLNRHDGGKDGQ